MLTKAFRACFCVTTCITNPVGAALFSYLCVKYQTVARLSWSELPLSRGGGVILFYACWRPLSQLVTSDLGSPINVFLWKPLRFRVSLLRNVLKFFKDKPINILAQVPVIMLKFRRMHSRVNFAVLVRCDRLTLCWLKKVIANIGMFYGFAGQCFKSQLGVSEKLKCEL